MHASPPTLPTDDAFAAALAATSDHHTVSAVLATYNRCPFDPASRHGGDNPLTWALDSLRSQAGGVLDEIVVVDDGSTDHTQAVLASYRASGGVPVRTVSMPEHRGAFAARNAGIAAARSRWLLFGDDDCVFTPHTAAGAVHALTTLRRTDPAAGGLMLPFYYRATHPTDVAPLARIGRLDTHRGEFATRFHAWPAEYGQVPPRLDTPAQLVTPLPVQLIAGTALIGADELRRAGGFVDLTGWNSSYSDHLHLSADLTDSGVHLYHCPDHRLGAAHLKWGAVGRFPMADQDVMLPTLGRRLGELINLAAQPRQFTGCRVPDADFHPEMIGSFFAFFAGRSLAGGARWAVRTWREFVTDGQVYSMTVTDLPGHPERLNTWRTGLARGARFLVDRARPSRSAARTQALLDQVCATLGQPAISDW